MSRVVLGEVALAALVVGVVTAVTSGLLRLTTRGPGRRAVLAPALLDGAIAASLAAVLTATLTPFDLLGSRLDQPSEVNVRPLEAMRGAPRIYAVINAVLLVPTVVLLAQRWQRAGIVRLTLTGLALSVLIEAAQLVHPLRGTNVDDLALNTAGAAVAAVVGVTIRLARRRRPRGEDPPRPGARDRNRGDRGNGGDRPVTATGRTR